MSNLFTIFSRCFNTDHSVEVELAQCNFLGKKYRVMVSGHTDAAEALIADNDEHHADTLEEAERLYEILVARYIGDDRDWLTPATPEAAEVLNMVTVQTITGISQDTLRTYRGLFKIGLPFGEAMRQLKSLYDANKATAHRPLNYFDNIYHGQSFEVNQ